jgi:hypothetical protein
MDGTCSTTDGKRKMDIAFKAGIPAGKGPLKKRLKRRY